MGFSSKHGRKNSLRADTPHQTVTRCGLVQVVRSLARAAVRAWLTEQLKRDELDGEGGRVGPGPLQTPPSEREDGPRG
jgi:hypothetical protein